MLLANHRIYAEIGEITDGGKERTANGHHGDSQWLKGAKEVGSQVKAHVSKFSVELRLFHPMAFQDVIKFLLHFLTACDSVERLIGRCELEQIENASDDLPLR